MLLVGNKIKTRPRNIKVSRNLKSFYDFKSSLIDGTNFDFNTLRGKKVLIVNTASKCGYTPQFRELQELQEKMKGKLIVLGFPSNNFNEQELDSNDEIAEFCQINYGVNFQMFSKSEVIGKNQNPLFHWLSNKESNGWNDQAPTWNFCKYLINERGELTNFFSSSVSPLSKALLKSID
ncbi:MAG: glutathione peroxidase [Bacteroidota bacterium]